MWNALSQCSYLRTLHSHFADPQMLSCLEAAEPALICVVNVPEPLRVMLASNKETYLSDVRTLFCCPRRIIARRLSFLVF